MSWFSGIDEDTPDHLAYREWLESLINGNAAYGDSELVLSDFMRVVTYSSLFEMPPALSRSVRFLLKSGKPITLVGR